MKFSVKPHSQTAMNAANTDVGVLYGAFHFLRLLQTNQRIDALAITERPRIQHRILNHWDNLDGSVEPYFRTPSGTGQG